MTWGVCTDPAIGFDLAHWQGTSVQFAAAQQLGLRWACAKTWHGSHIVASAALQLAGARAVDLEATGRYAWLLPDDDLERQANAWCSIDREQRELPLTIDWEHPDTKLRDRPLVTRLEWCIEAVSDKIGERPILYTGEWYWSGYCGNLDSEIVASCPLWLAAYPRKSVTGTRYQDAVAEVCGGVMPRVPVPWRTRNLEPIAWQFDGDKGLYLPGGADVDVNVAAWARLLQLVKGGPPQPGPTFPTTPATLLRAGEGEHTPAGVGVFEDLDDTSPGGRIA